MALPAVAGCQQSPDTSPATVRASDLARFYRERPAVASEAYDGKLVLLALTHPVAVGSELRWQLSNAPGYPPVVVCRFAGAAPAPAPVLWITGTCRGRIDDGQTREFTGYTFHVVIDSCRAADPPGR